MFNEKLKARQPIATKFLEAAIKSNKLNHAYMFTGSDIIEQYYIAMQVGKILNCENETGADDCACTNCSWITQNRHPAVITISPVDYTYGNPDSKGSTVISVNQARYLLNALATSSHYHRVVIFTGAAEGKEYAKKAELLFSDYENILKPPALAKDDSEIERSDWIPLPIKYETFNPAAPNSLLKTLEEPNPNVTFFFLTRDKEDMIDTIVSRCQVIPVLAKSSQSTGVNILGDLLNSFPPKTHAEAIYLSEQFVALSKQEAYELEDLLDSLQQYLYQMVKINHDNRPQAEKLINFIERIETTKLKLVNYVTPQAAIDSLFLSFIN
ncbi:MAG: DNA polymerase III subunit delta' [uncultured bacterium]|nr:MAG: DNA polymerase III subunit delta' [uncultured bacterium]HBH19251.1 hypothetical protein [Cyanobacteria bacterium UBA9579]